MNTVPLKRRTRPTQANGGYVAPTSGSLANPSATFPREPMTYGEAVRREKVAKAKEAELRIQQIEGELVKRDEVTQAVFAAGRRVKDGVLNVPARISGILAAEHDQARIFAILSKELRQCLEELAG